MKRVLHTTFALMLVMILLMGVVPTAQAQTAGNSMTVTIPVTITTSGSTPVDGAYAKFEITPIDGAPDPGVSPWFIDLTSGVTSGEITFQIPDMGVYKYKIQMVDGTYFHPEDGVVYYADCYNFAEGYDDQVEIHHDGSDGKDDYLDYTWPLMDVKVAKKWIDQTSVRPDSITVELLLNGERPTVFTNHGSTATGYEDLVLSSSNTWQRSWTGVDARDAVYSVKEVKVPAGYVASYTIKDGTYIITNTGALLQTGQLNWPIPVLAVSGILFAALGCLMLRKKEEQDA